MKKIDNTIRPSSNIFLFDLFQKNRIHPFYATQILNILNGNKLNIPHLKTIANVEHNPCVIADIPDYLVVNILSEKDTRKVKKIEQYKGFLIDLQGYKDSNDYLLNQLSKKSRKNMFSKLRKLENTGQISSKRYYGEITKEHYDFLFNVFYELFSKRFEQKKMYNKNLVKWKYYHELVYPLILDKKASLIVIYDEDKPIDISLNFHLANMGFGFMHTYDISYSNFGMGDIAMLKRLDWCFDHQITLFDLSMGETEHKTKWSNYCYKYGYHIFYNPKSVYSNILTQIIWLKLKLKQFLRDKNIIGKLFQYDKFFYKRRAKKLKNFNWRKSQG